MQVAATLTPLAPATKPLATRQATKVDASVFIAQSERHPETPDVLGCGHGLVDAIHLAYANHYPLVLRPDDFWLVILQGVANHLNAVAQTKPPQAKETLDVRTEGRSFQDIHLHFAQLVVEKVGTKTAELFTAGFSTSTGTDMAVRSIVLMDAFKSRFNYTMTTLCGIPHITLLGTREDWELLVERARALGQDPELDLGWWTSHLIPVLEQVAHTFSAPGDASTIEFWSSIYKSGGGSGGPYINGWIPVLFAYLSRYRRNPYLDWKQARGYDSLATHQLPCGEAQVPVTWYFLESVIPVLFKGGFLEPIQDPVTLEIRPQTGWSVERNTSPA